MAMGMTYAEFWDAPPRLAIAYRKAWRLKKESDNEQAWLNGLYVFDAFAVCLANAFAKRGAKKQTYIERPIDIFPPTEREKKRRAAEENAKMQRAMEAMIREQKRKKKSKGD
jgi:hypothetical protein